MTLPALGRFVTTYPPPRFPAHPRRASTSSTQPGPRPAKRGGRNLGLRYQQLDASIRNTVKNATDSSRSTEEVNPVLVQIKSRVPREGVEMFRGLVIPKEPEPPESDECCMSGCAVCVYDLYEDSLLTYRASLASLRTKLKSMEIPQSEWPSRIKSSPNSQATKKPFDTSLDAFEAMEKALKAKRQDGAQRDELPPKTDPPRSQFVPMVYEGMKWVVFSNR